VLDVGQESAEVPPDPRLHSPEPPVDEGRHVDVVGRRDRRVAVPIGCGDSTRSLLHDDELPRGHRQEPTTWLHGVASRAQGGRHAAQDEHCAGQALEEAAPRESPLGRLSLDTAAGGLSHRTRAQCIGPSLRVHLFGLTGGIASGKSTVAARLRTRGVPVIDADELAREVVAPGTDGLRAIVEAFGDTVLEASGALDRKALARVAFADDAARKVLNAITHPRIAQLTAKRAGELAGAGEPLGCYEAALLVENGVADMFRPLVVVSCPEAIQIERIRARDDASREDAMARVRAQKPLAEKVAAADFVIDTTGTILENRERTDRVLRAICDQFGVPPGRYSLND
jgi:dephospho-CoA kinase